MNSRPTVVLFLSLAVLFLVADRSAAQLIRTVDYSDTFTLGVNGRANGVCCTPGPYLVESAFGNPASTWTPQDHSFNDIPGSFGNGPTVLAAATGNPGAATGLLQSGGGDFSFSYGLRTNYVVQMDAFLSPGDRTDVSSVPAAGAGIFSQPSLSVFFRRDSIAGSPHPAFPVTGLPGFGIYNGAVETAVTDAGGNLIKTGVNDDNWHPLAVHFDKDHARLRIYVDGALKANLDLTTFAGGIYQNYSNGAVGAGGSGAFVDGKVLWYDNFQVGEPTPPLMEILDYQDTFTLGMNGRANGVFGSPGPYALEKTFGNPASTWTPQTNYSFNDIPGSFGSGPAVLAAATGNPGAATGMAQSGGGDFSFSYGRRANYVVQMDAFISPGDRTDISSLPNPGDSIFAANSLSVFFRRDSIGANGIGLFNGAVESHVLDGGGNPVRIGVDDDNWHNIAVHFNQDDARLIVYVDGNVKADLDLNTFAGGIYKNYSNGAVGAGGAGAFVAGKVLWFDNFQVGGFPGCNACFTASPTSGVSPQAVDFNASCTTGFAGAPTFSWDFGDGNSGSGETVQHTYSAAGVFNVTLTADDGVCEDTDAKTITVFEPRLAASDDFNRPDGPVDGWTVFSGNWSLSGNMLMAGPSDREFWIWAGAPPLVAPPNAVFEYDHAFLALGNNAVVGRHGGFQFHCTRPTQRSGANEFAGYFVDWIDRADDRGVRLSRRDPGTFVTLVAGQGVNAPPAPPLRYRVEVDGERIRVFGDGVKYIDIADSTYRGGHFGFWTWEQGQVVSIDNFAFQGQALTPCFTASTLAPLFGKTVNFDAGCSFVFLGGSSITSYDWDFGDGATASGVNAAHAFAAPGDYRVVLTVQDDAGASASLGKTISAGDLISYRECFDPPAGPVVGWTPALGTWNITAGGKAKTVTTGAEAFLYAGSPSRRFTGSFTAEVDWNLLGGTHPVVGRHGAVHFFWNKATTNRFAGDSSGYAVFYIDRTSDRGLTLARWDGAALTVLNPPGGTPSMTEPPRTLRIEVDGPRIRVFGDGALTIEAVDERYRDGLFALWSWLQNDIEFDNVRIWNDAEPLRCGTTFHLAGDCDGDGGRDISDIVCYIKLLFPGFFLLDRNRPASPCAGDPLAGSNNLALLDLNGDGRIDLAEPIYLARYLFVGGPPPVQGIGCVPRPPEAGCTPNPGCP